MIKAVDAAGGSIAASFARLGNSAARVAKQDPDSDPAREVVEQISTKYDVSANVAVIKAADQMLGSLIDIFA